MGVNNEKKEVEKYFYWEKKGTWIPRSNTLPTHVYLGEKKKGTLPTHVYLEGKKKGSWKTFQLAGLEPTFSNVQDDD